MEPSHSLNRCYARFEPIYLSARLFEGIKFHPWVRKRLKELGVENPQLDKAIERCSEAAAARAKEDYNKSLNCESHLLCPDENLKLTVIH